MLRREISVKVTRGGEEVLNMLVFFPVSYPQHSPPAFTITKNLTGMDDVHVKEGYLL